MECNYKFKFVNLPFERGEILFSKGFFYFDEVQGHLRAQRRPSCERQHHLRGTGHCPVREVSTSNPHNESIKNAHLEKSRWAFFRVRGFA